MKKLSKCGNDQCMSHITNVNPGYVEINKCANNCTRFTNKLDLAEVCTKEKSHDGQCYIEDNENIYDYVKIHEDRGVNRRTHNRRQEKQNKSKDRTIAYIVLQAFSRKRYQITETFNICNVTFNKYCKHIFKQCDIPCNSIIQVRKNPVYKQMVEEYYKSLT